MANDLCSLADRGFVFDRFDRLGGFRAETSRTYFGSSDRAERRWSRAESVHVQLNPRGIVEILLSCPNQIALHQKRPAMAEVGRPPTMKLDYCLTRPLPVRLSGAPTYGAAW